MFLISTPSSPPFFPAKAHPRSGFYVDMLEDSPAGRTYRLTCAFAFVQKNVWMMGLSHFHSLPRTARRAYGRCLFFFLGVCSCFLTVFRQIL